MFLDYEILRVIWWVLLGVLLIGFAVMDGFDLGAAMWLPFLGRTDDERRMIITSIAPTWEGNQVWFILGGGAIFAAWPPLYALSFSGFYTAMLVILLALILRPVGFKYRSKLSGQTWRKTWDILLCVSGFVPALVFGVAVGNTLQGVPFHFDEYLRVFYTGTFLMLLNPFGLLCGVLSVLMLAMHGAFFLRVKLSGVLHERATRAAQKTAFLVSAVVVLGGIWLYKGVDGFALVSSVTHSGPSNPLYKEVAKEAHAWFANYEAYPSLWLLPVLSFLSPLLAVLFKKWDKLAFVFSGLSISTIIGMVGVSMFPFILPSSTHPNQSLLVWDSSSSELTLLIMLAATVIFLPIVLLYTAWVYRVLRGKITEKRLIETEEIGY
jgi:cytochrome bd ubiquinol oxidase subunit II